jgi:hypothetical protein
MESPTRTNKPTIIATNSLSSLNIRRLLDNSRNHIKLKWVSSHVGFGGNESADQADEEISNQEPYPPQELMKWMKKEEFNNSQKRWERGKNDMKHRKVSVSWQNDTVKLSRKEQVVIIHVRTGYTRATHRHIIEKNRHVGCLFCA